MNHLPADFFETTAAYQRRQGVLQAFSYDLATDCAKLTDHVKGEVEREVSAMATAAGGRVGVPEIWAVFDDVTGRFHVRYPHFQLTERRVSVDDGGGLRVEFQVTPRLVS